MARTHRFIIPLALLASLLLMLLALPAGSAQSTPETFSVDPVHSSVIFRIRHLGVSNFYGRFNRISGGFTWDAGDPSNGSMRISIDVESVDTNNAQRDDHLKGPDFFNSSEFSTITFISAAIKALGNNVYEVKGNLTLRGQRKPVTATLTWFGARDAGGKFGYRGGFEATFTIKRSEFGMDKHVDEGVLGDDVTLTVSVEGTRG